MDLFLQVKFRWDFIFAKGLFQVEKILSDLSILELTKMLGKTHFVITFTGYVLQSVTMRHHQKLVVFDLVFLDERSQFFHPFENSHAHGQVAFHFEDVPPFAVLFQYRFHRSFLLVSLDSIVHDFVRFAAVFFAEVSRVFLELPLHVLFVKSEVIERVLHVFQKPNVLFLVVA